MEKGAGYSTWKNSIPNSQSWHPSFTTSVSVICQPTPSVTAQRLAAKLNYVPIRS